MAGGYHEAEGGVAVPGYDRQLDPLTGDYVDATGGEYAETLTIAPAVYHQVKGERRWWGDPDHGSDLYLVKQQGTGIAGQRFAENAIRAALQVLADAGLADDVEVVAEGHANGRIVMQTAITDVQHGALELMTPLGEG